MAALSLSGGNVLPPRVARAERPLQTIERHARQERRDDAALRRSRQGIRLLAELGGPCFQQRRMTFVNMGSLSSKAS